jgi:hypothetical protein
VRITLTIPNSLAKQLEFEAASCVPRGSSHRAWITDVLKEPADDDRLVVQMCLGLSVSIDTLAPHELIMISVPGNVGRDDVESESALFRLRAVSGSQQMDASIVAPSEVSGAWTLVHASATTAVMDCTS